MSAGGSRYRVANNRNLGDWKVNLKSLIRFNRLLLALCILGSGVNASEFNRHFILPCADQIQIDTNSYDDFADDWGEGDSVRDAFRASVIDKIASSVRSIDQKMTIFRGDEFCMDGTSLVHTQLFGSDTQSTIKSPFAADSSNSLYIFVKNIRYFIGSEFRDPRKPRKGLAALLSPHPATEMNDGPWNVPNSVEILFEIGAIAPNEKRIVYARKFHESSKMPLIDRVMMGHWTGATSIMTRQIGQQIRALQKNTPRTP